MAAKDFQRTVTDFLSRHGIVEDTPALVAYSGGQDSAALTHLLSRVWFPGRLWPAHVCHHLRPESELALELTTLRHNCRAWGLPLLIHHLDPRVIQTRSARVGLEAAAREERYRALEAMADRVGAAAVFLAHHANDDLETMVLAFLRGSTGRAQAGMTEREGRYYRPLLTIDRRLLADYCQAEGLSTSNDSTNGDDRFERNRVRRWLIPVLNQHFSGWAAARQGAKGGLLSNEAALDEVAATVALHEAGEGTAWVDRTEFTNLSSALRLRVLWRLLALVEPKYQPTQRIDRRALAPLLSAELPTKGWRLEVAGRTLWIDQTRVWAASSIVGLGKNGYLMSLLRDTWQELPGGGWARLVVGGADPQAGALPGLVFPVSAGNPDEVALRQIRAVLKAKPRSEDWVLLRSDAAWYAFERPPGRGLVRVTTPSRAGSEVTTVWLERKMGDFR